MARLKYEDIQKEIQLEGWILQSKEYVNLKKEILDNQYVKEYKALENELYFTVLDINKELNSLTGKRKC